MSDQPAYGNITSTPQAADDFVRDNFDQARGWSNERLGISLGAAAVLALGASLVTALVVRRRAEARAANRYAWLTMRADAMRAALPSPRQAAPFGGAGGALLMTALLIARARGQSHSSRIDELNSRLHELERRVRR